MQLALQLAASIDRLTMIVARIVRWGLLANALLIAANAISRKIFSVAWPSAFDMQWQFFAAVVLLMAAYTFQRDEHVRLDIFTHRLGERGMAWLDLGGIFIVLIPVCVAMVWASWPHFASSLLTGESRATRDSTSSVPAWLIKGMIPLGFALLALQGFAEAVRCVACIKGIIRRPVDRRQLIEGRSRG
jgi:TRAP-type mannitol/chloroaromatic compound transport system permease small subunit